MNIDAEWAKAVLRVIQATNVVLVHTPTEATCYSVRDLDINSLPLQLALTEEALVAVTHELALAEGDRGERRIDIDRFIWSVLRMHNASFCQRCGCVLCLQQIKETKWATCLALVRTLADVPASLKTTIEVGACWAFIHAREVPVVLAENTLRYLTQQSSITPNLLLTTLASQSRVDLDTLHELNQRRDSETFIRSKRGVC